MARTRDFGKEINIPRLAEAMYKARLSLRQFRWNMWLSVQEMVGRNWSEQGTSRRVPLNLIYIYQAIVGRRLISSNPRAMLSTWDKSQKAAVTAMQSWVNTEIENMQFEKTQRRVVTSALHSVGIGKVSLATPAAAAHQNWNMRVGQPYYDEVLLEDAVWDVHAKRVEELGYIGHQYRVPIDVVKDSKLYNKSRLRLEPTEDPQFDREGVEKLGILSRGFYSNKEEYEDFVTLWEIYLPRHRAVVTLPDYTSFGATQSFNTAEALAVHDWIGPDEGPYDFLMLGNAVPGNLMPAAPLQNLKDLHDPINNILRKLIRQAERQKTNLFVQGGATEDGKRVQDANDGDIIRVDNPQSLVEASHGGPNVQIFELMNSLKELFSWAAGNLDSIGGLSPQAKTLGQDKLLAENSSALIASMADDVVAHTRKVMQKLCWYWWYHPKLAMNTQFIPDGMEEYSIPRQLQPANFQGPGIKRSGRLSDMTVTVDPYSLQAQTPQSQMAAVDQTMQQIVIPLLQVLQQQGVTVDLGAYLAKKAKWMNIPDLPDIVGVTEPPLQDTQGSPDAPSIPQATNRTYTRVSQGNNTPANQAETSSQRMREAIPMTSTNGRVNRGTA